MRKKRKIKRCKKSMILQSLILNKSNFTKLSAKAWLKKHGFKRTLDIKENTYRARQIEPVHFNKESFRTIEFKPGIKGVIGCPK